MNLCIGAKEEEKEEPKVVDVDVKASDELYKNPFYLVMMLLRKKFVISNQQNRNYRKLQILSIKLRR